MVKTRVHDLAAEFGIPSEQLLGMLKDMGVVVRSHMSALEGDQVSAVRVRWEREKRKAQAEEPAAKKGRRRSKAADAEPSTEEVKPAKRRRTAAEVAETEAQQESERLAAEKLSLEIEPKIEVEELRSAASLEERAKALFRDLPPAPAEEETPVVVPARPASTRPADPFIAPPPPAASSAPPAPSTPQRPAFIPARVPRPAPPPAGGSRQGGPPGRAPRPVFSSSAPPAPRQPRGEGPAAPADRTRNFGPDAQKGGNKRGKKGKRNQVDQDAVQANILRTLQGMRGSARGKRGVRDSSAYENEMARQAVEREKEKTRIRVNEFISVSELATIMKVPPSQIVQLAFKELGLMVTVNQRLDFDQIELIASEFGFEAVREQEYVAESEKAPEAEAVEAAVARPPVVTIMGHVDHGKTSLLDYIRKASVVAGEAGGITQHIGAYHVTLADQRSITFLDTPGHQAFTAMRARGAQVTDIVVLVVAADDQVMPQTVEAISHAKNAGVPIIVAINKIDLPTANVQKVKQDLLQHQVVLEDFGGTTLSTAISAKKGTGVDALLEQILLQAEILNLTANPERRAQGTVLEATLDAGKGPLATVLVQKGTLRVGDNFICGKFSGRVRALFDERGKTVKEAGPSIPVQVLGFEGVPAAGDGFTVMTDAVEARDIAQKRQRLEREAVNRRTGRGGTLEDIGRALKEGQVSALRIIIKADQGGPAEALADALAQLRTGEVRVDVIHRGVGAITESDILLAKASGAIVLGFHVRPDANARAAAEREQVDVRLYRIIYEAVEDVKNALEGLLKPEEKETVLGEAVVQQLFKVSKIGTIAGCMVRNGVISRTAKVRVVRDGVPVFTGGLGSLKRFKDDVKEVREGLECGIGVENYNDLKVGDVIEAFRMEAIKRTLAESAEAAQG
ncbi:MAG TPA: translation initiation factor IF-2 [Gemmatimonadales bacterium]|nr:translation initiation factor IF-2 [Gemmatimonadales bacterium]